jgi:hypothetical protein
MPAFLGALAAAPGGFLEAQEAATKRAMQMAQMQRLQQQLGLGATDISGGQALGRALQDPQLFAGTTGYQPGPGPQAQTPSPGQVSQPAQPPMVNQPVTLRGGGPVGGVNPLAGTPSLFDPQAGMPGTPLSGGAGTPRAGGALMRVPQSLGAGGPPPASGGLASPVQVQDQPPDQRDQPPPQRGQQRLSADDYRKAGLPVEQLTLRDVVNSIRRMNPGIKPEALSAAVEQAMPMLRMEEQNYYKQLQFAQNEQKRLDRQYEFDTKVIQRAQEWEDKKLEVQRRLTQTDDKLAQQRLRDELTFLDKEQKRDIERTAEARRMLGLEARTELGKEKLGVEREKISAGLEKAQIGAGAKIETAKIGAAGRMDVELQKEKAKMEQLGFTAQEQEKLVRLRAEEMRNNIAARGIEQRLTEEQKQQGRMDLGKMNNNARVGLEAMRQAGRFDLAMTNIAYKTWHDNATLAQRWAAMEYVEAGKDYRSELSADTRLNIATQQNAFRQQQMEMAKRRLDLNDAKTEATLARAFGPTPAREQQILEHYAPGDQLQRWGSYYSLANKLPTAVDKLPMIPKQALTREIAKESDRQLLAEGVADPEAARRANQSMVTAADATMKKFLGTGTAADNVRFLGVAQSHASMMMELGAAWQARGGYIRMMDIPALNRVKQFLYENYGLPESTNIQMAAQFLGTELIKSMAVARAGTGEERQQMMNNFSASQSWEQMKGSVATAQGYINEQLKGLRQEFVSGVSTAIGREGVVSGKQANELFDKMLTPHARDLANEEMRANKTWGAPGMTFNPDDFRSKGNKNKDLLRPNDDVLRITVRPNAAPPGGTPARRPEPYRSPYSTPYKPGGGLNISPFGTPQYGGTRE